MTGPISRRDLGFLLPILAAAGAGAQETGSSDLQTKLYHHKQVPYTGDDNKKGRRFFYGTTHTGYHLEMHETILGPGTRTHEPHKHEHEEILVVFEGTLEMYNDGKTDTAETGSVIYFGSNQMHSVRNIGTVPARYYVLELRASGV